MRPCFRTIDKPHMFFGLELEDIASLATFVGIGSLLFEPLIPGVLGMLGWVVLVKFKSGKPLGYLLHWIYAAGFDLPGLVPNYKKNKKLGVYGSHTF